MIRKYLAFVLIALRSELRHWQILGARVAFFGVLMLILSRLWQAAFAAGLRAEGTASDLVWYLAATEWMVLSVPGVQTQIEDDVRDGSYAYFLGRPVSYISMRLAEAAGQLCVRCAVIGAGGFGLAYLAAGSAPQIGSRLPWYLLLGFFAALIMLLFQGMVGLSALWLQESTPLYWIWQKLLFTFGGLMLPLSVYPEWLQRICEWLPFYALLYAPARLVMRWDAGAALETALLLALWGAAALALLSFISDRAEKTVVIGGG